MRGTTSPRLVLELLCARMQLPDAATDSPALLQRIERLERRLSASGVAAPEALQTDTVAAPSTTARKPSPAVPAPVAPQVAPSPPPEVAVVRAEAGPGAAGILDAAALRRLWPEILDVVRRTSRRTRALLDSAQIVAVDGDLVQLSAPAALARMIAEQSNAAALARALTDVVGGEWHVDVRAAEGEATQPDRAAQHDTGNGAGNPSQPPETDPREDAEQIDEAGTSSASAVSPGSADSEAEALKLLQQQLGARPVRKS